MLNWFVNSRQPAILDYTYLLGFGLSPGAKIYLCNVIVSKWTTRIEKFSLPVFGSGILQ